MKEDLKIIACAIKRDNGYIYTGEHHGECDEAEWNHRQSGELYESTHDGHSKLVHGARYMTNEGEVVDRYTALEIVQSAGQVDDNMSAQGVTSHNFGLFVTHSYDLLQAKGYEKTNNKLVAQKLRKQDEARFKKVDKSSTL